MSDMDVVRARRTLAKAGIGPELPPGTEFPEVMEGTTRYREVYLGTCLCGNGSNHRGPMPRWAILVLWSGAVHWMKVADVIRDDEHPGRRWTGEDPTLWVTSGAMAQTALNLFEDVLTPEGSPK